MSRLAQHRTGLIKGFTSRYGAVRLVWFETAGAMETAIPREKRIKKGDRDWKIDLIENATRTGMT